MSVDVVLVNWNSGDDLRTCLGTLAGAPDRTVLRSVTVVDNASTDGSAAALPAAVGPAPVTVLGNAVNRGFAAACNQGAATGGGAFVLFLNTDVEVADGALTAAVDYLNDPAHARVGICGVQLTDRSGAVTRSCARFPTPADRAGRLLGLDRVGLARPLFLSEWDHGSTREVDHVMGAFFLVRRAAFEPLNGFDERFFVFYEDLDFSLRAREHGWSTVYLASAQVVHSGEAASRPSAVRQFYAERSMVLYGHKHFSRLAAVGLAVAALGVSPLVRAAHALAGRQWPALRGVGRTTGWLWREAPALVGGRGSQRPVP